MPSCITRYALSRYFPGLRVATHGLPVTLQEHLRILRNQGELDSLERQFDKLEPAALVAKIHNIRLDDRPIALSDSAAVESGRSRLLSSTVVATSDAFTTAGVVGLGSLEDTFKKSVRPLIRLHHHLDQLVLERSPHTKAYEAAIAQAFHAEREAALASGLPASDVQLLRAARCSVGMSPPRSDESFSLHALWCVDSL